MRILLTVLLLVGCPILLGWWIVRKALGTKTPAPAVPAPPRARVTARLPPPPVDDAADLLAYPRRLAELEDALAARQRAAREQLAVLAARRAEVGAKPGREDLALKYEQDETILARRAESMRHVLAVVYKTRSLLLLRVHLAVTARRRPALEGLPAAGTVSDTAAAASSYHAASAALRFYMDTIDARTAELPALVPPPPPAALLDEAMRAAIAAEEQSVRDAHAALRERMDQVADTLTYLGDHFATRTVVDAGGTLPGGLGSPAQLLAEVSSALEGLDMLAGRVDAVAVDSAVGQLADQLGRLEALGLDARAETDAHLEVERLLGRMTPA